MLEMRAFSLVPDETTTTAHVPTPSYLITIAKILKSPVLALFNMAFLIVVFTLTWDFYRFSDSSRHHYGSIYLMYFSFFVLVICFTAFAGPVAISFTLNIGYGVVLEKNIRKELEFPLDKKMYSNSGSGFAPFSVVFLSLAFLLIPFLLDCPNSFPSITADYHQTVFEDDAGLYIDDGARPQHTVSGYRSRHCGNFVHLIGLNYFVTIAVVLLYGFLAYRIIRCRDRFYFSVLSSIVFMLFTGLFFVPLAMCCLWNRVKFRLSNFFHRIEKRMTEYYPGDCTCDPWLSYEERDRVSSLKRRVGDTVFVEINENSRFGKIISIDSNNNAYAVRFYKDGITGTYPLINLHTCDLDFIRLPVVVFGSFDDSIPRFGEVMGSRNNFSFYHVRFEDRSVEMDIPSAQIQLMTFESGTRVQVLQRKSGKWIIGTIVGRTQTDIREIFALYLYNVKFDGVENVQTNVHAVLIRPESSLLVRSVDVFP
jgi:hypothetical protein